MEMMNDNEADWSDLPFDLLSEITDKVTSSSIEDYIRFGCVCVQWRSFFLENYEQIRLSNLPVLLVPSFDHHHHSNYDNNRVMIDSDHIIRYNYYSQREMWLGLDPKQRHTSTRSFYSLSEKKVYDFQLEVPSNLHCRGSSHGWLLLVEECPDGTYPVHLFNPFRSSSSDKKNKIQLPPLTSDDPIHNPVNRSGFMKKVVFSTDPLSSSSLLLSNPTTTNIDENDFIVLGLYDDGDMGLCRPGDIVWTAFSFTLPFKLSTIYDVICYKGQFWGTVQGGGVFAFDIYPEPKVTILVDPPQEVFCWPVARYLVESAGDLFNVRRVHSFPDDPEGVGYSTVRFHVFKLDQTAMEWVETNTLDGHMFFLGDNSSIPLSPSDYFPESCKPNSIYFTDDHEEYYKFIPWDGPHDIGLFNLEDGSLEPHYISEFKTIMPAPIWIQPML